MAKAAMKYLGSKKMVFTIYKAATIKSVTQNVVNCSTKLINT